MLVASDIVVLLIRVDVGDLKHRLNLLIPFLLYIVNRGVSGRSLLIRIGVFMSI